MASRVARRRPTAADPGDAAIAALAWAAASAGIVLGGKPLWVALVVLAVPMLAFVAFGHLAGRGAVIACIASALGSAWPRVGRAPGGGRADRLIDSSPSPAAAPPTGWPRPRSPRAGPGPG